MDKSQVLEKAMQYTALVNENMKPQKIILYGSYAKGNSKEDSDIDIAIVVDKIDENFLDMEVLLYKLRRHVDDRIEPILIDCNEDKSGFLDEILKHGQIIYSA
jgi:predicted nucleotidyltransferase